MEALQAESFFASCPEAVGIITDAGILVASNRRFERTIGPAQVLLNQDILNNCVSKEDHGRFKIYMQRAREAHAASPPESPPSDGDASDLLEWAITPTIRSVSTMAMGNKGDFPIWRKMDWSFSVLDDTRLIMTGRLSNAGPTSAETEEAPEGAGVPPPPSERELLDFLNKAPIAMHWLSGTGHVLWANETEMNVLGYTAEEYIGQPIMNFCPDDGPLVLEIFKSLGSGCAIKDVPVRFRTKDGRIKHLLIDSNVNWNADGSFKHTRCFIRDDTSRKVREERLRVTREKELELAKAKDVFFRKIFHEIRTPSHILAHSISAVGAWVESNADEHGKASMAIVSKDWRKLLTLVDDAADASLFHLGRVPLLRPQSFSVKNAVLDICNEMVSEKLIPEGVSCSITLGHGGEKSWPWSATALELEWTQAHVNDLVTGDRGRITRVLRLLTSTALQRTKNGHVKLQVTFWPGQAGKKAAFAFSVSDNGPALDTVWVNERFHSYFHKASTNIEESRDLADLQLSEEQDTGEGGCDLGLFVSFNLVQTLGGCLECFSEKGKRGTTFTFTIPLAGGETGAQTAFNDLGMEDMNDEPDLLGAWTDVCDSAAADEHVQRTSLLEQSVVQLPAVGIAAELKRRPHVLIADQSYVSQRVGTKLLKAMNCTVEVAANGHQALQLLQDNPECYDAVLMELRMPVMDGIECARQIRLDQRLDNLPLIAFLSDASMEREQVEELGFQGMCVKPATRQDLQKELDRVMKDSTLQLNGLEAGACGGMLQRIQISASPVAALQARHQEAPAEAAAVVRAGTGAWKCLIVEDNPVCLRVARKMMEKLGFVCETADNGLKAVNLLTQNAARADLVLMDLRMPVMDGLEATKKIRQELNLKSLAIVALTGELVDEAWSSNFNGVINKPADISKIRCEITRIFPEWVEPPEE